jgi:hypothetical protein
MAVEIDNIRADLQRCVAKQDNQRGLELAGLIAWYWITRATSEGIRWFDALLPAGGGAQPPHALVHFLRGFLAMSLLMASIAHRMAGDRASAASVLPYLAPLVAEAKESTTAALGEPRFQAEFEAEQGLSRDAAIALALGERADVAAAASSDPSPLGYNHTVDTHIRNILNELGVNSRAQIAAWMASSSD